MRVREQEVLKVHKLFRYMYMYRYCKWDVQVLAQELVLCTVGESMLTYRSAFLFTYYKVLTTVLRIVIICSLTKFHVYWVKGTLQQLNKHVTKVVGVACLHDIHESMECDYMPLYGSYYTAAPRRWFIISQWHWTPPTLLLPSHPYSTSSSCPSSPSSPFSPNRH